MPPPGTAGESRALFRLLCHGKFVEEGDGRGGPHGYPGDLPAGISSFKSAIRSVLM